LKRSFLKLYLKENLPRHNYDHLFEKKLKKTKGLEIENDEVFYKSDN